MERFIERFIRRESPALSEQLAAIQDQELVSTSVGVGEPQVPQPSERMPNTRRPPVYEGVPVAQRPNHQQTGCTTCGQVLEPQQRQLTCHVCSSWIHDTCVEILNIGSKWNVQMCLTCQ